MLVDLEMTELELKWWQRKGKDAIPLEIYFGGRIIRNWRRMECGYTGLNTSQIFNNVIISYHGRRRRYKNIFQI